MATLSSLFGQDSAVQALCKALDANCLPGAYLILGAVGVGKGAVACAFAQAAACLAPRRDPFDACGECESCRRAEARTQPEIVNIRPAGDHTQIGQFWDRDGKAGSGALSHSLSYAPVIGKRRVYIIQRADTLTESAANSLLKVLEDPPSYAMFVLQAPHASRVLPTIVSRCQIVRLRSVPVKDLSVYLSTTAGVPADRAAMLAAYAEGRIGQAMQFAQNPALGDEIARVLDFAETLPASPRVRALRLAEQLRKLAAQMKALIGEEPNSTEDGEDGEVAASVEKTSRRQYAAILDLLVAFYRDLFTLSACRTNPVLVNRDRTANLTDLAQYGDTTRWIGCLDAILLARRRLDANANINLLTESLAMRLVG